MADAIGPANISHNSGQRIIRVFSASLSGDRGRTAAAAEGPWTSHPAVQGLSQSNPSRTSQIDPAQAQYIWQSIVNSCARDNAPSCECPAHHWQAYILSNAAAYGDELEMVA